MKEKIASKFTRTMETATRKKIDSWLKELEWENDEESLRCNVFTERAKTTEQNKKFRGKEPDYVLYKAGTDIPIAIIEAKRKGESIDDALKQAMERYARPLSIDIIFAVDGTFVKSWSIKANSELTIDQQPLNKLISEKRLLRFIDEGSNIEEVTQEVQHTREELIRIFKWANDLLRKEGLRNLDRFVEFSNILFIKIISEIEDDREDKGMPRQLNRSLCWESFASMDNAQTMLNYINNTVLRDGLAKEYNHSDDIFQEKLKIRNAETVKEIVKKLSKLKLLNTESEIKGDAFEYFLKSLASGNDLGEYFTPRHIVKLMVDLVDPKFGETVFDPFCGTGGFLIESFRHIKRGIDEKNVSLMKKLKEGSIFGIELTDTYKIAKMNMIITGDGHNNIVQDDTAKNEYWENIELKSVLKKESIEGFDIIISNIPYGQTTDFGHLYPVPSNQGDSIFVQHIINALKKGGRCAVIVPEGFLFRRELKSTRKYLLENCSLDTVISLPTGVFLPYTGVKTDILVFQKGNSTKKIWYFNVENDGFELNVNRRKIKGKNDINYLAEIWNEKPTTEKSWYAGIDEIKMNDFSLSPSLYTKIKRENVEYESPIVLISKMKKLEKEIEYDLEELGKLMR